MPQKMITRTDTLEELRNISQQPLSENEYIKEWKDQGGKVVGWLCTYVPEEIIHAAGMLPVRVLGDSVNIMDADAYLYANTCFFARSCLELGLQRGYDFLDALVAGNTCDPVRRLYDVWRKYLPVDTMQIISIPHKVTERAYEFYSNELNTLKEKLEEVRGKLISKESLKESLFDFNFGYIGTAFLAGGFVALGAFVMNGSGQQFSAKGGEFAAQLIDMYTSSLGNWAYWIIAIAALTTMFSTTITVLDAYPRVLQPATEILFPALLRYSY